MTTDNELISPGRMKVTATNSINGTFDEIAPIRPLDNAEIFSSETTIGMPPNDDEWAPPTSIMTSNSGWFAETTNDSGWVETLEDA